MKTVILDSSSAILLFRCNIINTLLKYYHLLIPYAVFTELTVPGYAGSDVFIELCSSGFIKVYKPVKNNPDEPGKSLHIGEREVISLFLEGRGDFVIIDDGKGGAFCRDNNIPYINALLAVKILNLKQLINGQEYFDAWGWLTENGRYSEKIIEWAENADEKRLEFFL
jgi:predicted nucleic acid-binding protein